MTAGVSDWQLQGGEIGTVDVGSGSLCKAIHSDPDADVRVLEFVTAMPPIACWRAMPIIGSSSPTCGARSPRCADRPHFRRLRRRFEIHDKLGTEQPEYVPDFVAEAHEAMPIAAKPWRYLLAPHDAVTGAVRTRDLQRFEMRD